MARIKVDPANQGIRIYTVPVTVDAGGDFTTTLDLYGEVVAVWLDKDDLDTPDLDLSDTVTGELFLTVDGVAADTMYHPKVLCTTNAGGALTNTENALQNYFIGNSTITVSGAGNAKSGTIYIYVKNG